MAYVLFVCEAVGRLFLISVRSPSFPAAGKSSMLPLSMFKVDDRKSEGELPQSVRSCINLAFGDCPL